MSMVDYFPAFGVVGRRANRFSQLLTKVASAPNGLLRGEKVNGGVIFLLWSLKDGCLYLNIRV